VPAQVPYVRFKPNSVQFLVSMMTLEQVAPMLIPLSEGIAARLRSFLLAMGLRPSPRDLAMQISYKDPERSFRISVSKRDFQLWVKNLKTFPKRFLQFVSAVGWSPAERREVVLKTMKALESAKFVTEFPVLAPAPSRAAMRKASFFNQEGDRIRFNHSDRYFEVEVPGRVEFRNIGPRWREGGLEVVG
jgi:hypothetical protein